MARPIRWLFPAAAFLCLAWAQGAGTAPPHSGAAITLEDSDQSLGPFVIAGQTFTVILHSKSLSGVAARNFTRTLARLELRDHSAAALYQKTFPYQMEAGHFRETITADARLLPGDNLTGLLVTYTRQPAPPGTEQSWQMFGFRNGKLALFDPPTPEPTMNPTGRFAGIVMITPNGPVSAGPVNSPIRGPLETVELRAWTGNFYVIVPLRVDWRAGKMIVGQPCLESGGGPGLHEAGCDMRVEAEHVSSNAEFNFVRIFPTPEEQAGISVQHAVIPKGADVQILKARSIATWVVDGDVIRLELPNLWLKVLINNNTDNEGWIHGEQDLAAIGLPARSPLK